MRGWVWRLLRSDWLITASGTMTSRKMEGSVFKHNRKTYSKGYDDVTFNPIGYIDDFWGPDAFRKTPIIKDMIDDIHSIFQKLDLNDNCKQLDFGCGPSIHMTISSSRISSHIILTEFAAQNRETVMNWLKGEDFGWSWNHLCDYIGQKEGRSAADIEKRVRTAIKEVLPCDTEKEPMFGVAKLPLFDVVTTSFCLEAACKDYAAYKKAIAELGTYLRPNGYLVMSGVLNQTFYTFRDALFSTLGLCEEDINVALTDANFETIKRHTYRPDVIADSISDGTEYFTLYAQKNNFNGMDL